MPFIVAYLFLGTLAIIYDKAELHLLLNGYHSGWLDVAMRGITEFGGALPFVIVALLLLYRVGGSLYLLATLIVNVLITNGLKLLFAAPRPVAYFAENHKDLQLPLVEGVEVFWSNGFPSGHTSAVFATMFCLTLIFKRKSIALVGIITAILTAYSRIYLSQHFAEDILLGCLIGTAVAGMLYKPYERLLEKYPKLSLPIHRVGR